MRFTTRRAAIAALFTTTAIVSAPALAQEAASDANGDPTGIAVQIFDNTDFGYHKVTIERPDRRRAQFNAERLAPLRFEKSLREPMEHLWEIHGDAVYDAGFSPVCPTLFLPLFLRDEIPQEHKDGIDMALEYLRRARVLVVCGSTVDESVKNDIAVAERLRITATTLDGILTVKGQGRRNE